MDILSKRGYIFIWASSSKKRLAIELLKKWGYNYVQSLAWIKESRKKKHSKRKTANHMSKTHKSKKKTLVKERKNGYVTMNKIKLARTPASPLRSSKEMYFIGRKGIFTDLHSVRVAEDVLISE